ncbi:TetR/AcrR family transcriptional regulator C-terminal domain-containing protein [Herbidospora sp. NBRC 101105]|uniref:TetR/AcrR family transcriptional regulator C-terminal domain-containing protein n=1 Tax=Herbidospora sp. NBRC 101105 TaxID=3032195 RepID=UPI0024A1FB8D|nr:TetR/AcrR family transcriptional regulator C-terminal domain-containing protein [Herbidospora sp. NBRC 101105]GLX97130.1 GntR family transcriptional regulator [Herbidospora sp. NBRC 101105]
MVNDGGAVREHAEPASARITAELRRRIITGVLAPGDRVPSTRQIVREWGVAMATASKVLAALRNEGLVEPVPGVGTVVTPGRPRRTARPEERRIAGRSDADVFTERIVRTATTIADAEGLAAATMRRIATGLDVATMALYRRVRGKNHLVTLMADAAFAEDRLPARPGGDWRAQLELVCRVQWAMYRRHPWLAHVVSLTRPLLAPNAIAHTEWTMRAVSDQGLDPLTMIHVAATVAGFVRGTAVSLEREAEAEQDTGLTDDEWLRTQGNALAVAMRAGSFPFMAGLLARDDVDLSLDTLFEFGLQRMLDGIAPLCSGRRR